MTTFNGFVYNDGSELVTNTWDPIGANSPEPLYGPGSFYAGFVDVLPHVQRPGRPIPIPPWRFSSLGITVTFRMQLFPPLPNITATFELLDVGTATEFSDGALPSTFLGLHSEALALTDLWGPNTTINYTFEIPSSVLDTVTQAPNLIGTVDWTGRFGFRIQTDNLSGIYTSIDNDVAGVDQRPFFNAVEAPNRPKTGRVGKRKWEDQDARDRECPKCGGLEREDLMVEDGYLRNTLVCAGCYDPPEHRFKPLRGVRRGQF